MYEAAAGVPGRVEGAGGDGMRFARWGGSAIALAAEPTATAHARTRAAWVGRTPAVLWSRVRPNVRDASREIEAHLAPVDAERVERLSMHAVQDDRTGIVEVGRREGRAGRAAADHAVQ